MDKEEEDAIPEESLEEPAVLNRDNMELVTKELRAGILEFLRIYHRKTPMQIVEERYERFRRF